MCHCYLPQYPGITVSHVAHLDFTHNMYSIIYSTPIDKYKYR